MAKGWPDHRREKVVAEIVDASLKRIAKGTTIVFFGTVIGMGLTFLGRVMVVRCTTQSEYGIFSLALVLLNVFVVLSILGMQEGTTRQLAYYRGKDDNPRIKGVVLSSLQIGLIASILFSIILFFTSDIISTKIFHDEGLTTPLKIFSIATPFLVLIIVLTSIFRGFDRVDVKVYFYDILRNILFPLFLIAVILLSLPFIDVIYAFLASIVLTFIALAIYAIKKSPLPRKTEKSVNPVRKELLLFSLPLLGVIMLNMILSWTDTIVLGFFKTSDVVGLYNTALPLAVLTSIIVNSMIFIHIPVISQLYSKNLIPEIKKNYQILSKWILATTLPIFLILLLFPGPLLNLIFGSQYVGASIALQILAIGHFTIVFLGPNGPTLLAMGKTKLLMYASLISATMNVILNIVLIPLWGIAGAATATTLSIVVGHIFNSVVLYRASRIHPFNKNFLKPMLTTGIIIFVIYILITNFITVSFWMLPLFFVLFLAVYASSLLLTKSFGNEDITLLLTIEKRTGIDATLIKRVLKRFM